MNYTLNDYVGDAVRTESVKGGEYERLADTKILRLLHAFIGIGTESGELQDALKKHIWYGKPLDVVNVEEELGDVMWYWAVACDAIGANPTEILERNIAKLRKRYPEKFTAEQAVNRDLAGERAILESRTSQSESAA